MNIRKCECGCGKNTNAAYNWFYNHECEDRYCRQWNDRILKQRHLESQTVEIKDNKVKIGG